MRKFVKCSERLYSGPVCLKTYLGASIWHKIEVWRVRSVPLSPVPPGRMSDSDDGPLGKGVRCLIKPGEPDLDKSGNRLCSVIDKSHWLHCYICGEHAGGGNSGTRCKSFPCQRFRCISCDAKVWKDRGHHPKPSPYGLLVIA